MSDITKKVSVIMSVYGYQDYVDDSIKSILNQTLEDFEFIIFDDGCDYDLLKVIEEFGDKRIIYVKNSKNLGLTRSLIKGIRRSKGKYIARQDAGNISLSDRLEMQYRFLEENSRYYLVGSSVELIDENSSTICKIITNSDTDYIKKNLPLYNCINHSTIMFRNTGKIGYRGKFKYSQDYDFYLNLLSENYILGNIPDVLSKERIIPSSITYLRNREQEFFKNLAQQFYFERVNSGSDSYNLMNVTDLSGSIEQVKEKKPEPGKVSFYERQKIYYLLFSGRNRRARKQILSSLKVKFDFKLFTYLVVSFFPFIIKLTNKLKGLEYR